MSSVHYLYAKGAFTFHYSAVMNGFHPSKYLGGVRLTRINPEAWGFLLVCSSPLLRMPFKDMAISIMTQRS